MFQSIPLFTKNLIIINVVLFIIKKLLSVYLIDLDVLFGAYLPSSPNFASYQVVTHLFMHGDFTHLIFNMIALWSFGSSVEYALGQKRFLILYLACGLGAFVLYNAWNYYQFSGIISTLQGQDVNVDALYSFTKMTTQNQFANDLSLLDNLIPQKANPELVKEFFGKLTTPMVGASGAIYGLLAGFALMFPNQKIMMIFPPIPIKAKIMMPLLMLVEFYLGLKNYSGDNTAHFAHLGGALIAFIILKKWKLTHF